MKERVVIYIDGFNFYHSIEEFKNPRLKWCNLRKLFENFIDTEKQEIKWIYLFSAYSIWNKWKKERHKKYVKVLQNFCGVSTVLWSFKKVNKKFSKLKNIVNKCIPENCLPDFLFFETHEEKETDVNIALRILEDAFLDKYDNAFIVSWDSDLAWAIKTVRRNFKNKKFTSVLTIKTRWKVMRQICDFRKDITKNDLEKTLLPEIIELKNWKKIEIPKEYLI